MTKKWGEDEKKWPTKIRSPFRLQDEKEKEGALPDGYTKGAVFMRFKSDGTKHRPAVVDQNKEEILEERRLYPGCWARASISAFAYDQAGNKGVSFSLNAIQLVRDGEPFSARPRVEDVFEPIPMTENTGTGGEARDATSLF